MEKELRRVSGNIGTEKRAKGDTQVDVIWGYASLFDSLSQNLGGFREQVANGAFDEVMEDDVRALFNHDPNLILARTVPNTLKLKLDDQGLRYEFEASEASYAKDLVIAINRGDVTGSSFAFSVEEDDWQEDEDGRLVRTIKKFKRLFDVSPVTYPAYPDTTVAKRSMEEFKKTQLPEPAKYEVNYRARQRAIQLLNF